MTAVKFARPEELPEGFLYRDDFLSEAEEAELLRIFGSLDFEAYDYHGYLAKRRVVRYGASYALNPSDIHSRASSRGRGRPRHTLMETAPPIPNFLLGVRERAAAFAEVPAGGLVQALVSEYSVGTPIGWHRDAPQFGTVVGISLGSACRMRLKPDSLKSHSPAAEILSKKKILSLRLEPRSIYVMRGPARSQWQHSIPAVEEMRYSITFRTLRSDAQRGGGASK